MHPAPPQRPARHPAHSALLLLFAALLGTSTYSLVALWRQRAELDSVSAEGGHLRLTLEHLRANHEESQTRLAAARAELSTLAPDRSTDHELESAGEAWLARVSRLKRVATEQRDVALPEFELLTENDWFAIAKEAKLDTAEGAGDAVAKLQDAAKRAMGRLLRDATIRYAREHGGLLPPRATDLATLLPPKATAPMLARYELLAHGALAGVGQGEAVIAERLDAEAAGGTRLVVSPQSADVEDLTKVSDRELRGALVAYRNSHGNRLPEAPAQLLPFFRTPLTAPAQRNFLEQPSSAFTAAELKRVLNPE